MGKKVSVIAGAMYAQYRCVKVNQCLVLPADASAADGASCYVNPLTALGFVETMKFEKHTAIVHTAAASNLGQMLLKICQKDGINLVNIVRKPEQEALLRRLGAKYVCNQSSPTFMEDLTQALVETGATLGFDATGGGKLAGQILMCMEAALNKTAKEAVMARRFTSRSTSTAAWTWRPPSSTAVLAWPGASAAGWCFRS
jgi:NADPH:quinone reductase